MVDKVRITRAGGKWEAAGFLLIVAGIVVGLASDPRVGWIVAGIGIVVFLVGRFK